MNTTIPRPMDNGVSERNLWKPAVTVATIVPDGKHFLLVEETIRGRHWFNQPAGHLEPDETLLQAALRETREETAWEVELSALIAIYQWRRQHADGSVAHILRFTFLATPVHHHSGQALDEGIIAAHWLCREDIERRRPDLRSPLVLTSIDDYQKGRRLPLDLIHAVNLPGV